MSEGAQLRPGTIGWDHPRTAVYYEAFCERHGRYREANEALVAHAFLCPGHRVLDLGAGTGRTAEAVLPFLGANGSVLCVEPAGAMRAAGAGRLTDARVAWESAWPDTPGRFDRILCGAAMWQFLPLGETFRRLRALLGPGGALCFNIPSLYLGEPDEPGGGRDPLLTELPALVARGLVPDAPATDPIPSARGIELLLDQAGYRAEAWRHRYRLTQAEYRDWWKIPVLTDCLLRGLDPDGRACRIDEAYARADPDSWRWERWSGWTAWAVPHSPTAEHLAHQPHLIRHRPVAGR